MGFWTGIKHALNSTLGTSEFKPLDKIIEGQRSLAASDSVIRVLFSGSTNVTYTGVLFGSFVPQKSGSIRVLAKGTTSGSYSSATFDLTIKEAGTTIATASVNTPTAATYSVSADIPITAGVSYEVYCHRSTTGNFTVNTVELCAAIVDTSLVEVL